VDGPEENTAKQILSRHSGRDVHAHAIRVAAEDAI